MNETIKRDRSPNYPKLSLEDALKLAETLYKKIGKAKIKPETAVRAWDYTGLNGAALTTLGTLTAYGLLERERGVGLSVSANAIALIHPTDPDQLAQDKAGSALNPKVFQELFTDGFRDADPELIRNHLIQKEFTPDAAGVAADVYVKNFEFANLGGFRSNADMMQAKNQETVADRAKSERSKVSRSPLAQFVFPKPADQPPDVTAPPLAPPPGYLILPLESGNSIPIPKMTQGDYDLFLDTLKLWKHRIVIKETDLPEKSRPTINLPADATWKAKDSNRPVKIVALMGEKDGERYFQSQDGTGIPESQLVF